MEQFAKETIPVNLEDEMRRSYLDYAMSVIVGRALPDVRDGLKPVHRRVLFAMHELGNDWNKAYKKSARVVGDVIGKYHPHGDTAVYDTIVRMAQNFSLRYMLIDGQGNFGSVDGDAPAAMRYTEIRMARIAHEMLADLDKETVDFAPNYDGSEKEPVVLPARIPNLLVNGSSGIAVGMATNIPPHNLNEVINACLALIDNENCTIDDLMKHIPGPDFPTAGIIHGVDGIHEAYRSGRGRVYVRARAIIESDDKRGRQAIVVTELPYQVNKALLLERIAELVHDGKIEDISELRDESDKSGMRMVIELKRGAVADVILNNLYEHTAMQSVFGINAVALVNGQPRLLNLKELLEAFLRHRREVVTRRSIYDLRKSRERAHILEGLAVALESIDEMIALIKAAKDPDEARTKMLTRTWPAKLVTKMLTAGDANLTRPEGLDPAFGITPKGYRLTETQAQAILDLRLHRLTGLEQEKLRAEYGEILKVIADLLEILAKPGRLMKVIRDELLAIREQYGDERRTEIVQNRVSLSMEDLIADEDVVVTLSHAGYIKAQPLTSYRAQRRGGRGKAATSMKEEDFVDKLLIASTHATILCFTSLGKVYWKKVYEIPQAGRGARGKPIVNLLSLDEGEHISAILPVKDFDQGGYVFMATTDGTVKKTGLSEFTRPRSTGIRAIELKPGNQLIGVGLTDGKCDILLFSDAGKVVRFDEDDVREMGRTARGVRGLMLKKGQSVKSLIIACPDQVGQATTVLTATQNGFGKRTPLEDYPKHRRGGQGVISIQVNERNGSVVSACVVGDEDQAMLITSGGTMIRTRVKEVSIVGRNTQGVHLIGLEEGEHLAGLERVAESEDEE
ncbi:MAG: DNA gyrase subunit A [Gammaproteobacteria bacterium]|nr:DNA gyrase subunit A [Gammaproteobacteria bacterium]MDH3406337.1 DNA gyrase subunit A [Gammaproteobacteria bacterium]MDH3562845.1 DNA gyrase subunit A [Gammaproteobacteria bacterium]MDH5487532.1 DNA gyrase subunit A [Gammaproteobacteria bacterium]